MPSKISKADLKIVAEYISDTFSTRKQRRTGLEKTWAEIDRQLRMEPDASFKKKKNSGEIDEELAWMPEVELPGQSQTLEVLTADARRLIFPKSGPWYQPHANMSDEYLDRVDFSSLISGDENDVPTQLNQDNVDNIVRGALNYYHRQYDLRAHVDLINAEAFKYSVGVGRVKLVNKSVFQHEARGVMKADMQIPVLIPRSIKHTYLDDNPHNLMNEGFIVGPAHIFEKTMSIQDLKIASSQGSNDPKDENGGWMPSMIRNLEGDKDGNVRMLELCGDISIPRKSSGNIFVPEVQISMVIGKEGKDNVSRVCRVRFGDSNIILFPYHQEHIDSAYATSPLMKGLPIQAWAVNALTKTIEASELNTLPPISYDEDDPLFQTDGGPKLFPGAKWGSTGKVDVHSIGNPAAMFSIYGGALSQYADVTGVNAPRLGAQTVSHTTAYAKEAELSRGTVRTVDYVDSTLKGPLTRFLDIEYKIAKKNFKKTDVYIDSYKGYVTLSKNELPDQVVFDVHGSGGPQEEQAKQQRKLQSLQLGLQMDQMGVQMGKPATIDLEKAIIEVLSEGGWTDVDAITGVEEAAGGTEVQSGMEQAAGGSSPGLITSGLPALE